MKKLLLLTIIALLSFALLSCNDNAEDPSDVTVAPESDFEYEENADGGITITKYKGNNENVVIPKTIEGKNVTELGSRAFDFCNDLKSVVLPENLALIGESCFESAGALTSVKLPSALKTIKEGAFLRCISLCDIELPEDLETIEQGAFSECYSLKEIIIPGSFNGSGSLQFAQSGLEKVKIRQGVKDIPFGMFSGTLLTEVEIPDSVEIIRGSAFVSCSLLSYVKFGKNVKTIEELAFWNALSLKEVIIPASVESISDKAFLTSGLEKMYFEGNAPQLISYEEDTEAPEQNITVYYHKGAKGFGETWNGYKTQVW